MLGFRSSSLSLLKLLLGLLLRLLQGLIGLLQLLSEFFDLLLLRGQGLAQNLHVSRRDRWAGLSGFPGLRFRRRLSRGNLRHQRCRQKRNYAPSENRLHLLSFCLTTDEEAG